MLSSASLGSEVVHRASQWRPKRMSARLSRDLTDLSECNHMSKSSCLYGGTKIRMAEIESKL